MVGGFGAGGAGLGTAEVFDPASGIWTVTAPLPFAITSHTATLLPDGKVLVAGGFGPNDVTNGAAVFDPAGGTNGSWTMVGSLNIGRWDHSAILLPNGKVLVVGGEDRNFNFLVNAEIFDPATGQWTPAGSLGTGLTASTLTVASEWIGVGGSRFHNQGGRII